MNKNKIFIIRNNTVANCIRVGYRKQGINLYLNAFVVATLASYIATDFSSLWINFDQPWRLGLQTSSWNISASGCRSFASTQETVLSHVAFSRGVDTHHVVYHSFCEFRLRLLIDSYQWLAIKWSHRHLAVHDIILTLPGTCTYDR